MKCWHFLQTPTNIKNIPSVLFLTPIKRVILYLIGLENLFLHKICTNIYLFWTASTHNFSCSLTATSCCLFVLLPFLLLLTKTSVCLDSIAKFRDTFVFLGRTKINCTSLRICADFLQLQFNSFTTHSFVFPVRFTKFYGLMTMRNIVLIYSIKLSQVYDSPDVFFNSQ